MSERHDNVTRVAEKLCVNGSSRNSHLGLPSVPQSSLIARGHHIALLCRAHPIMIAHPLVTHDISYSYVKSIIAAADHLMGVTVDRCTDVWCVEAHNPNPYCHPPRPLRLTKVLGHPPVPRCVAFIPYPMLYQCLSRSGKP